MTRVEPFRLLTHKMKLLLLSRLTKRLSSNKTSIINILLCYNYLSNKKIRK